MSQSSNTTSFTYTLVQRMMVSKSSSGYPLASIRIFNFETGREFRSLKTSSINVPLTSCTAIRLITYWFYDSSVEVQVGIGVLSVFPNLCIDERPIKAKLNALITIHSRGDRRWRVGWFDHFMAFWDCVLIKLYLRNGYSVKHIKKVTVNYTYLEFSCYLWR